MAKAYKTQNLTHAFNAPMDRPYHADYTQEALSMLEEMPLEDKARNYLKTTSRKLLAM